MTDGENGIESAYPYGYPAAAAAITRSNHHKTPNVWRASLPARWIPGRRTKLLTLLPQYHQRRRADNPDEGFPASRRKPCQTGFLYWDGEVFHQYVWKSSYKWADIPEDLWHTANVDRVVGWIVPVMENARSTWRITEPYSPHTDDDPYGHDVLYYRHLVRSVGDARICSSAFARRAVVIIVLP